MTEILKPAANAAQIEHWNAVAGKTWAQYHELLDRQIEALGLAAIDALEPTKGEQVLDIGCGCGQTSLALADRVGSTAPWSALIFRPRCLRSRSIARARIRGWR
jgi:2-polyprenyl-3-methyl-5-hydroxy-6-metoxy-1,4-benzoquinol methylase